ncbi:MAG: AAA family ATPase [bacterium]
MYLKRIEIIGFKSFAQKSVLDFDISGTTGITAVVGPNGSGKSNVADAIRWVTGDQSSKNLRSKKSEDIIFCGSSVRPRGSYAQVTLLLADKEPFKFQVNNREFELSELEISRKLFRSGDSDYLINNKKVRLTDIQQLLASLGFGQSSYTVIGQGMVDRLLFFSPSERKVLFDEAAGVKQYEIKREQSLRKLESTDLNLIRLRDILTELEPRVTNLRRLVKRAEGRKELEAQIQEVQTKYYGALVAEYSSIVESAEVKKTDINNKILQIENKITLLSERHQSATINPFTEERKQLEDDIAHEISRRNNLREGVAYLRGQIESLKRNEDQSKSKKKYLETENESIEAKLAELRKEISHGSKELKDLNSEIKTEQSKLLEIEKTLEVLDQELANPKTDNFSKELAAAETKKEEIEAKRQEITAKLYNLRQEHSISQEKQEQAARSHKALAEIVSSLNSVLQATQSKFSDAKLRENQIKKNIALKENELDKVAKTLDNVEKDLHELASQVTDSNISELESEISLVVINHRGLLSKISAAKNVADFAKIKLEYIDFGANLDKMLSRFKYVAKAVNHKERDRIENLLLEARSRTAVKTKELQALQFDLVRTESEISSLEAKIADTVTQIKTRELEKQALELVETTEVDERLESELAKQLGKYNEKLAVLAIEIRKNSGAASERQNMVLRQKDLSQQKHRELRQIIHNLELEISRKQSRQDNFEADIQKNESRIIMIINEISDIEKAATVAGGGESEQAIVAKERELSRAEEDIAKLRGGLTQLIAKEREHEQRTSGLQVERQNLEREKTNFIAQLSALDIDFAKVTIRLEDVNFEINSSNINIPTGVKYDLLDQMEKDVLKLKIDNIRRKIDTTVGIDPEMEAEYHELEARATAMTAQVTDLANAKADLEKVVSELDERIKGQFSTVFKEIAIEFNKYFSTLFSGGTAKLSLGENEDGVFGIDISANPPGKRIQSLSSLSGGERTMTSLALLFAILSVNPSPFVVLDEVDAALDESNTIRYVEILKDLAKKTQFIVISHNRDTMKSASLLYGVTMDESHISKLLSVKLNDALVLAK